MNRNSGVLRIELVRVRGMTKGGVLIGIRTDEFHNNLYSLRRNYMRSEEVGFA